VKVLHMPTPPRFGFLSTLTWRDLVRAFLAFWIVSIAAHDAIRHGKIEDSVLVLVGLVLGYYFKEPGTTPCKEPHDQDR
jgi:hypothetical protein